MAHMKGHEAKRYLDTLEARLMRHFGVNIESMAAVGQDYESLDRVSGLDNLPEGEPLRIQDTTTYLFTYLPGVDGPVISG